MVVRHHRNAVVASGSAARTVLSCRPAAAFAHSAEQSAHFSPCLPPDHLFELAPGFYAVGDCYGGREYGEASGVRCRAQRQACGTERKPAAAAPHAAAHLRASLRGV